MVKSERVLQVERVEVVPVGLTSRVDNPHVRVLDARQAADLNPQALVEQIIWGWKRDADSPRLSRTIYFSGKYTLDRGGTWVESPFLFYAHWGAAEEMQPVVAQLQRKSHGPIAERSEFEVLHPSANTTLVRIISGKPTREDCERLSALAARQPEPPAVTPPPGDSVENFDLESFGINGCDLLAGSGLSYEAGLPMLKEVHDLFWVDDRYDGFCLGDKDLLPGLLMDDMEGMFRRFAEWHTAAARVQPSEAHRCLAHLQRSGFLHNVYTDNIDRLCTLAGLQGAIQVRGSGVVNEFHPVQFHPSSNALLVVGVSADRRGIISQARERGLKIVVVNPYIPVSPGAKNLDYLRNGDVYYRLSAGDALPRIAADTVGDVVAARTASADLRGDPGN